MRSALAFLMLSFSLSAPAKESGLADYCGILRYDQEFVSVTLSEAARTYRVVSSEQMSIEFLLQEVPNGAEICVRGWIDYDDPNRIILHDFFPY